MDWISENIGISNHIQLKIIYSFSILLIIAILRYATLKILFQRVRSISGRYYWKKGIKYVALLLEILIISGIWVNEFGSLATFFGLLSAGLAVALKDPISNFFGWLFIIIRNPFSIGDRIQIGDFSGDVIDIRIFQFTINEIGNWVDGDMSTGRIIHIPNGKVFTEPQANFTQGFNYLWNEISVMITFESNWTKAKDVLTRIVETHAAHLTKTAERKLHEATRKFMIIYNVLTPIVFTDVKDSGVVLTMRYLCKPKNRRISEHKIWEDVLKEFALNKDIDFAYPTTRIYYNKEEGKQAKPGHF